MYNESEMYMDVQLKWIKIEWHNIYLIRSANNN
jgi:hypothetical protein